MDTKKFVLLDIDYITKNSTAIIRLFGKLLGEDNDLSIIALDKSFKHYIYVLPNDFGNCLEELNKFDLLKVEKVHKNDLKEEKDFLKITFNHPRDLPKLKKKILTLHTVDEVREHDIPFYRRYLIDKGLFPMSTVEVKGHCINSRQFPLYNKTCMFEVENQPKNLESSLPQLKVLSFNISVITPQGMPVVSEDPINMISLCSNQGLRKVLSTKGSSMDFVEAVPDESELLKRFVEIIKSENPDIIAGYNSDKFDFPYIKERADQLGISLKLGVDGSKLKFISVPKNAALIKGRTHIDLYRIVRRHLQLNSHTIQSVYQKLFSDDKIDIPLDHICACWNDDGEKLEKLFRYSLEDTIAITKIGERMLPISIELARIVGQPLFEIVRRGTGTQVKWYLIRKSHEFGYILPNEPGIFERNVVGGYVEEPVPGLHENIVYFDFRSLYPSIIVAKNISPETLCKDGDEETYHIAPEFGYKFKKEPLGFIPAATSQILNDRIRIKSMMKESTDPGEKQILNFRQEARKTLISTIYGLFNHPQYRWYSIEASEAITAWGREFLKKTMEKSENYDLKPIYADTDGFYATYTGSLKNGSNRDLKTEF
jgi:DNA polymerase I